MNTSTHSAPSDLINKQVSINMWAGTSIYVDMSIVCIFFIFKFFLLSFIVLYAFLFLNQWKVLKWCTRSMTCKVYTNEGQLGNQGCLQGLPTATKLKVIPPLLDQLPVHTALQSVSQTLGLNCSRTSFCGFTLEVIAGISWQIFFLFK